jgi:pSer/pThr/pTyr-binding forkhead associated (FHA) protein
MSRALTSIIMCGAIALMIGIIEALSRSAWLRLELGRNEGKEWVLDKPTMLIGRLERADVPLFGDQNVAQQHAVIQKQNGRYFLMDQGSPIGTGLNGQRVQQMQLNPGDVIQIGGFNLRFLMRNVKAPNRGPEPNRGGAYPMSGGMPTPMPGINPAQPMNPTQMMPGPMQPMHPTQMGGMQPTQQVPYMPMNPTVAVQSQPNLQPTVAVAAQPGFQQTVAVQAGGFTLVAMDGPLMGQRYPLGMPIELGRECQQVPMGFDTSASRKHARIEPAGMFVNVSDLGSTNGTFVNGQRVTNATAKNGDIVKVGATSFRIEA